jgi:twinkle protein
MRRFSSRAVLSNCFKKGISSSCKRYHSNWILCPTHTRSSNPLVISTTNNNFYCTKNTSFSNNTCTRSRVIQQRSFQSGLALKKSSTFVSAHFRVEERTLTEFFKRLKAKFRRTTSHLILEDCPTCPPHKGKQDNKWKLYVSHQNNGAYFCHRCGGKGSWFDLKGIMTGKPGSSAMHRNSEVTDGNQKPGWISERGSGGGGGGGGGGRGIQSTKEPPIPLPDQHIAGAYPKQLLEDPRYGNMLDYLTEERGLTVETISKYCVGASEYSFRDNDGMWSKQACMTFPWITPVGRYTSASGETGVQWQITRVKARALHHKHMQRLEPAGGGWGLFGWHTVPEHTKSIVLTEGEFDAMAVHQATGVPAVSLPNGCNSLPVDVLPLLERFERIYLWMDDDVPGREGSEKFATKLGPDRCLIVRPLSGSDISPKDANDALLSGCNMRDLIERAKPLPHKEILTFREVRNELRHQLANPVQAAGKQFTTLPSMNAILKGHRRGELSIITGPTGAGKTTFLSQVSLDLCNQGVNTLWGSFEIKNIQLMKKMLTQYAGNPNVLNDDLFEHAADGFEALPMYFMRFYGSTEIDEVLDAMDYAVYVYDVEHILLDNLQFMLSSTVTSKSGFERYEAQERALEKFRRFATDKNVHLSLVIHPRKEQDDALLNINSVFGTAKATQEADNVLILQKVDGKISPPFSEETY